MESGFKFPDLKELSHERKVAMAVSGGADSYFLLCCSKKAVRM